MIQWSIIEPIFNIVLKWNVHCFCLCFILAHNLMHCSGRNRLIPCVNIDIVVNVCIWKRLVSQRSLSLVIFRWKHMVVMAICCVFESIKITSKTYLNIWHEPIRRISRLVYIYSVVLLIARCYCLSNINDFNFNGTDYLTNFHCNLSW